MQMATANFPSCGQERDRLGCSVLGNACRTRDIALNSKLLGDDTGMMIVNIIANPNLPFPGGIYSKNTDTTLRFLAA
jgi:hypothetical protein